MATKKQRIQHRYYITHKQKILAQQRQYRRKLKIMHNISKRKAIDRGMYSGETPMSRRMGGELKQIEQEIRQRMDNGEYSVDDARQARLLGFGREYHIKYRNFLNEARAIERPKPRIRPHKKYQTGSNWWDTWQR